MKFTKIAPFLFVLVLLALVLGARLTLSIKGYTMLAGTDEPLYVEPAVNYVLHGRIASPGLAPQLALMGAPGLNQSSFLNVPIPVYLRMGLMKIFGAGLTGRRISDWIFTVTVIGAFSLLAFLLFPPIPALFTSCVFAFHPLIIWSGPGRPDLISLTFGLLGFGVVARCLNRGFLRKNSNHFMPGAALGGLLIGLSGFSHQFGGVFWTVIILALMLASTWKEIPPGKMALWICLFFAGEFAASLIWLPQIWSDPHDWWEQIQMLPKLKLMLDKKFWVSARVLLLQIMALKPLIGLGLLALPFIKTKGEAERRIIIALGAALVLLAIWRCRSFEYYNLNYSVHFLGTACILFGIFATRTWEWVEAKTRGQKYYWIYFSALAACIFAGREMSYKSLMDAFFLPRARYEETIAEALERNIGGSDKALITTTFYFAVNSADKIVMCWTDHLDVSNYDVVITPDQAMVGYAQRDVYWNCFTSKQARDFESQFARIASVPDTPVKGVLFPSHPGLTFMGMYIYRRKPSALDTNNDPEHATSHSIAHSSQ